jgi:ligand-binding sensor domain-containing protein
MNARFHSLAGITSPSVAVILARSLSDPLAADDVRDHSTAHECVRFIQEVRTAKEGLPNPIHRLLQTSDGYLWPGTEEGLARFDGVKFTSYRDRSVLANRNLKSQALYETRDGSLWYGPKGGLNRFRDGIFNRFTSSEGLPDNHITALCEDAGGGLWVGTRNGLSR